MKKIISWYNFGALVLFIGLFWMFLSHAFHERLISQVEENFHIIHIFEGLLITITGLIFMLLNRK